MRRRRTCWLLAEGRSAGLEAVFAWQYSGQIRDEVIRSGVRSLLQSISIFRMREIEDARSLAGLAMEVYSDRISIEQDEQERLRFSPDAIEAVFPRAWVQTCIVHLIRHSLRFVARRGVCPMFCVRSG